MNRCLKCTFWSNLCVGAVIQILDILQYTCGLKCCSALTLNQNAHFKVSSRKNNPFFTWQIQGVALLLGISLILSGCSQEQPVEKSVAGNPTIGPVLCGHDRGRGR